MDLAESNKHTSLFTHLLTHSVCRQSHGLLLLMQRPQRCLHAPLLDAIHHPAELVDVLFSVRNKSSLDIASGPAMVTPRTAARFVVP